MLSDLRRKAGHSPAPHLVRSKQRLVAPKQDFNGTSISQGHKTGAVLHGVLDGTQDCRWQQYIKIGSRFIPKDIKLEQYLAKDVEQINQLLASYSVVGGMFKGHLVQHVS